MNSPSSPVHRYRSRRSFSAETRATSWGGSKIYSTYNEGGHTTAATGLKIRCHASLQCRGKIRLSLRSSLYCLSDTIKLSEIGLDILLNPYAKLWYTLQCTLNRGMPDRQRSRYRRSNEGQLRYRRTGGRGTRRLTATNAPVATARQNSRSGKDRAPMVHTSTRGSAPTRSKGTHNRDGYARGVVRIGRMTTIACKGYKSLPHSAKAVLPKNANTDISPSTSEKGTRITGNGNP